MIKRRKFIKSASSAAIISMGIPNLGFSGTGKKVKLKAWNLAGVQTDWLNYAVPKFNASQSEYDIEIECVTFPGRELAAKIIGTFIAGSGSPDLCFIQEWDFTKYIRGGYTESHLMDLTPKLTTTDTDNLFYEESWSWGGKTYGLNIDMSLSIYYYRKDIFDDIGEDPNSWKTYDDYITAGKKLKKKKNAFMSAQDIAGWNQYLILAHQNGGGWFTQDGMNVLNRPANVEALELWLELVKSETNLATSQFYSPGTTKAQQEGKIAGMLIPDWYHANLMYKQLPDLWGKWRIAALPRFKTGGARTAHRGGTAVSIFKNTNEADAVWKLMEYLFLDLEGSITRITSPMGQFPSYKPVWSNSKVLNMGFEFFAGQKINKVLADVAPECPDYYAHPFKIDALNTINSEVLPEILDGNKSPKKALDDAKDILDETIEDSGFKI